jgi:hypothetical protein
MAMVVAVAAEDERVLSLHEPLRFSFLVRHWPAEIIPTFESQLSQHI